MGFGYLGTAVSMSAHDIRLDLVAAQKVVDNIENEIRVLKSRGAPAGVLGGVQIKLRKATERRDELRARLKVLETRGANLAERADEYDDRADAHKKQLLDAVADEARTRKPQTRRVSNILAEMRMDRDKVRSAVFKSDKAKFGLEEALELRINRFVKARKRSEATEQAYKSLQLSKATRDVLVRHANENQQFFTSVIALDQKELATLRTSGKIKGTSVAVDSPAALPPYQANLLRNTKRALSLTPGATVPSEETLRLLYIAVSRAVPRRKGESQIAYHMRLRRYVYRAAIRLANYRQRYRGQKGFSEDQIQKASVRDTVVTDSKAIEEEVKANVFAPAGEQSVTSVVDAATGVTPTVVATPATPAATTVAAKTPEFVPSTAAQQAASAAPPAATEEPAVAVTTETTSTETPAETPAEVEEEKPFWKRPLVLTAAAVAVAVVGYNAMRGGRD